MTMMQPALLLLFVLPPPSTGTLALSGRHCAGAGGAADRQEALVMQRAVGNVVLADECEHLLAGPVEQRVHLDQAELRIDGRKRDAGTVVRLVGAQSRDPSGGSGEGTPEWSDLAHSAAGVACLNGRVKSIDALAAHQGLDSVAFRVERLN